MKKFIAGLVIGSVLSLATAVYASDTLQAYLFPFKLVINGEEKTVDGEYATLNYNGHAYVPIRFVAEHLGALVRYKEDPRTISIDETTLSDKLVLDESFLKTAATGKLPGVEFGIGAARNDVLEAWGEPHRTGTRQVEYESWFDYDFYFSGPNETVGAIGVKGKTIAYTVEEVKKALGTPASEGQSLVEDGWSLTYTAGDYALYFSADKEDGTIRYMTFKRSDLPTAENP